MNTELEQENKIRKKDSLLSAYNNNLKISDMNLHNKFDSFEDWELMRSKRLLYEISKENNKFKRFPRGSIVKVDFGVNIGNEFSQQHFAITLNKQDNIYNGLITVIPLTSKPKSGRKNLGSLIVDMYISNLKLELKKLQSKYKKVDIQNCEFVNNFKNEIKQINKILKYYKKTKENLSYACVDQIRTISKLNILPAINDYDIVGKKVCDKSIMDIIDKEIVKKYTGIDYPKFEKWFDLGEN